MPRPERRRRYAKENIITLPAPRPPSSKKPIQSTNDSQQANSSDLAMASQPKFKAMAKRERPSSAIEDRGKADKEALKELEEIIMGQIKEVSRQKMRALQMSLRRFGYNADNRISQKDLYAVMQEHHLKFPSKAYQIFVDEFEDGEGLQYEEIYKCLDDMHSRSGRDSVVAFNMRNDLLNQTESLSKEERAKDIVKRITTQFEESEFYCDLEELRTNFQKRDLDKKGRLSTKGIIKECKAIELPIYGAVLKSTISRCDENNDDNVSWPEFMNYLDKAHKAFLTANPDAINRPKYNANEKKTKVVQKQEDDDEHIVSARIRIRRAILRKEYQIERAKTGELEQIQKSFEQNPPDHKDKKKKGGFFAHKEKEHQQKQPVPQIKEPIREPPKIDIEAPGSGIEPEVAVVVVSETPQPSLAPSPAVEPKPLPSDTVQIAVQQPAIPVETQAEKTQKVAIQSAPPKQDKAKKEKIAEKLPEQQIAPPPPSKPKSTKPKPAAVLVVEEAPTPPVSAVKPQPEGKSINVTYKKKPMVFYMPDAVLAEDVKHNLPDERLQLSWVYGYRGNDCRNNLHSLASGEIAYFIARIVVLYQKKTHAQRHYKEHTTDVRSLAVHSDGMTLATGQECREGLDACVRVWRSDTLETLKVLSNRAVFTKAVTILSFCHTSLVRLAFTNDGTTANVQNQLVAIDSCSRPNLSVWDFKDEKLVASTSITKYIAPSEIGTEVICDVRFNPKAPDMIVSIGKEHLTWWLLEADSGEIRVQGTPDYQVPIRLTQTNLRAQYIISMCFHPNGDLITGDSNGTIYVWGKGGFKITNMIRHGHDYNFNPFGTTSVAKHGPIFCVTVLRNTLITGGRDGCVYNWAWGGKMERIDGFQIANIEGGVRTIIGVENSLFVGTTVNSIIHVSLSPSGHPLTNAILDKIAVTQGHFDNISGLATVRSAQLSSYFVTAGLDGIICLFDAAHNNPVWKHTVGVNRKNAPVTCCDISANGDFIVAGTHDGLVVLLQVGENNAMAEIDRLGFAKEHLTVVRISPDCTMVVAGTEDGNIFIAELKQQKNQREGVLAWESVTVLQAHSSAVSSLDWTNEMYDHYYVLRSSSLTDLDTSFWNMRSLKKYDEPSILRNLTWQTNTCALTYSTANALNCNAFANADISCVDVRPTASGGALTIGPLAVATKSNDICLLPHPCLKSDVFCHTYTSPSRVQHMLFTANGKSLITLGGKEHVITQWSVV